MRISHLFILILFAGCHNASNENLILQDNVEIVADDKSPDAPVCPYHHTDSIIPVIYGFPTEENFQKVDSGLVALGGCELADENWYCKIHKLSF